MGFIAANLRVALAIALVVPLVLSTGLVNPIDRGLGVITHSKLEAFLDEHPDLRHKKWLVLPDIVAPAYVAAHGLDVFNTLHVIPDLAAFKKLDPESKYLSIYNSSGYLIVRGQDASRDILFENVRQAGGVRLSINPRYLRLRDIGIEVLAFRERPPADWVEGLKLISPSPVDTFWLYEIP